MQLAEKITAYATGPAKLRKAITGLSEQDLKAFPVPGTWSIQQIVMHLMDSDLIASDRMKRVIAEDNPTIIGYNESRFANNLFYHELSITQAIEIFDLIRQQMSAILRKLPAEAFSRVGQHNEQGQVTLADLLDTYINHLDHHLKFVYQKRELLGKPLSE